MLLQNHTVSSTQLLLGCRNFAMLSKSGMGPSVLSPRSIAHHLIHFRHLHQSQNLGGAGAGGKTPYGAGARTPARTPGHVTPGHMSVRQVPGRTPNPYGGQTPAPPPTSAYGGAIPNSNYAMAPQPPPPPFGYQTPAYSHPAPSFGQPLPPNVPPGMNPQRAAMIQNEGAWTQSWLT